VLTPEGLAVDPVGNVLVANADEEDIVSIAPGGAISPFAGSGVQGWLDGPAATAEFDGPCALALDDAGNLYVADRDGSRIRRIAPGGDTTTVAGNGDAGWADGTGGPDGTARFSAPRAVAVDASGNLYVADAQNNRIRKIAPDGSTTTLAGNGVAGWADGPGDVAEFQLPSGIAVDAAGNVYVGDSRNNRIREIGPDGTTTTLAGNGDAGWIDGSGAVVELSQPQGLAIDGAGNVFVADLENGVVREVAPDGTTTTLAGTFREPEDVALDARGDVYVADTGNGAVDVIRR